MGEDKRRRNDDKDLADHEQDVAQSADRDLAFFEFKAQSPYECTGDQLLLEIRFDYVYYYQRDNSEQTEEPQGNEKSHDTVPRFSSSENS